MITVLIIVTCIISNTKYTRNNHNSNTYTSRNINASIYIYIYTYIYIYIYSCLFSSSGLPFSFALTISKAWWRERDLSLQIIIHYNQ